MSLAAEVRAAFDQPPPSWVAAFVEDPVESLTALFAGSWYHDGLNAEDPERLLLDWADGLSEVPGFPELLDESLATWIRERWRADLDDEQPELKWHRALLVAASLHDQLPRALAELRARTAEAPDVLGPMTRGITLDPMGWYWTCLAEQQVDNELEQRWWALSELAPGTPWFHGRIGLLGLRRLPGQEMGGFREPVAFALLRLANALDAQVEARMIKQTLAQRAARAAARELRRSYPFPTEWDAFWSAHHGELDERPHGWLAAVLGEPRPRGRTSRGDAGMTFDRSWPRRTKEIAERLRRREPDAMADAEILLAEQRRYAAATGDRGGVVRALCALSSALLFTDPPTALAWAEEARRWDEWNPFAWTSTVRALAALGHDERAVVAALEAVERFPDDDVARNGLADVLKARGDLDAAEATYRDTIEHFPDNVVARAGLAGVLKAGGDLDAAEATYRDTIGHFPDNVVARNGLAEVLRARGDLDAAEATYRDTIEQFPDNVVARNGLAEVLRARGDLAAAEAAYCDALQRFPDDDYAQNGLAAVRRQLAARQSTDAGSASSSPDSGPGARSHEPRPPLEGPLGRDPRHAGTHAEHGRGTSAPGSGAMAPDASTIPAADRIRSMLLLARLKSGSARMALLAKAREQVDDELERAPRQIELLFTKVEVLLDSDLRDEARELLRALPAYVAQRPEFLALAGRLALDEMRRQPKQRYDTAQLDSVLRPWEQAGSRHSALGLNVPLVRLRASSLVYDGEVLDDVRHETLQELRSLVARSDDEPSAKRGPHRNATLRAWWRGRLTDALPTLDDADTELSYADAESVLVGRPELLDKLERELIDASRFTSSAG